MKSSQYLRVFVCVLAVCLMLAAIPWYAGAVNAAEVSTTTTVSFESALSTTTGLPENWTWVDTAHRFTSAITEDPQNASNHVFKIGGTAGSGSMRRAGYHYSEADTLRAVLEYKVYLPSEENNHKATGAYLPTLSRDSVM